MFFSAISPPVLLPSQLITGKAFLYSNDLQQWRLLAKKAASSDAACRNAVVM